MITAVTTTCNRPLCFSLLEKWIARQTVKPDQWIVANSSDPFTRDEYRYTMGQKVCANCLVHSLHDNWLMALPHIKGEKIIVLEDDDYYCPTYIETMSNLLDEYDLAGLNEDVYWKFTIRKFQRWHNRNHASLAATAFRSKLLPQIERCCTVFRHSVFIDMIMWAEQTAEPDCKWTLVSNIGKDKKVFHVGFKMMPGARGLGNAHTHDGSDDKEYFQLKEWIGEDYKVYKELHERLYP